MDKKIEDGKNAAFPWQDFEGYTKVHYGMSLRDYFAGQAVKDINSEIGPEGMAKWSYEVADAMIKARETK